MDLSSFDLPFHFVRVPNLNKLKLPNISLPSSRVVLLLIFVSYYLVFSGIIYDIIVEPPSIGSERTETGAVRPVVFLQYRINGQYIIEGLTAGMMFIVGGIGFILLHLTNQKSNTMSTNSRYVMFITGAVLVLLAYNLSILFLRMKLPGYQRGM
eukprot:TRINITY_DN4372_c0_g1_i1.p1 TRINITY_DN4372_c0_g1~~TRINITY_DN4372_c0_g1_i1.p1  ORF type:complete len:154 (+),score=30.56 TRINITY_DN4372_c0_g1_i1:180-641(+)